MKQRSKIKQKTKKAVEKRIKITSSGKILRRHQLGAGHLKRKKTKGALLRHKKMREFSKGDLKSLKKLLNL
ncbi:50S ribosomal protein L35 [Candidatus Daviesbacteria bacterium]|nr:50S ribosomal protein L35 [Candidatus Daviesbacteria bacterium]